MGLLGKRGRFRHYIVRTPPVTKIRDFERVPEPLKLSVIRMVKMNKAQAINGEISCGDWVIVASDDGYNCLIGQVTDITPRDSPKQDDESQTNDIHVNFVDVEYSDERKAEIVEQLGEWQSLRSLDDVVISPDNLIRISGAEISDEEYAIFEEILDSRDAAEAFCKQVLDTVYTEKHTRLLERLDANFEDYRKSLMDSSKDEIINKAERIVAVTDAHDYLTTTFGFDEAEIDYLLQFQNPLEVVADELSKRISDKSDMSFAVWEVFDKKNALQGDYELVANPSASTDFRHPTHALSANRSPSEQSKPKLKQSLGEKLQAAGEKAKAQIVQHADDKSRKKDERC